MNTQERIPYSPTTNSRETKDKLSRKQRLARRAAPLALLAAGVSVAVGVGGAKFADAINKDYTYSTSTHQEVAGFNEGLQQMAGTVKTTGETADLRDIEEHLKETNPGLQNGLQNGEAVQVPDTAEVS